MKPKLYYAPVSEAIEKLRKDGFKADFNLKDGKIDLQDQEFDIHDFEVLSIYRYEGHTDPADEAVVYGIQNSSGLKGVLVAGYGPSSEDIIYDHETGKIRKEVSS